MQIDSMKKLFSNTLQDIYNAQKQIVEALPQITSSVTAKSLKNTFKENLENTKLQGERLKEIFDNMNQNPGNKVSTSVREMIQECKEVISHTKDNEILDTYLISWAQKVEHYKISCYQTARMYADIVGNEDARDLLQCSLDEGKDTDKKLTELAVNTISVETGHKTK